MHQQDSTVLVYDYDNSGNRIVKTVTLLDSDNDGLPNTIENNSCTNAFDADTDDDGLSDGAEDSNFNGIQDLSETDPCNIDSDNDGIQDGTEKGITVSVSDPDGNGPLLGIDPAVFRVFPASLHSYLRWMLYLSGAVMFVLRYGLTGRNSGIGLIIPGEPLLRVFENSGGVFS